MYTILFLLWAIVFSGMAWLFFACSQRIYHKYYPNTSKKLFVDSLISDDIDIDDVPDSI